MTDDLLDISNQLQSRAGLKVVLHSGPGSFLYVRSSGRSAEVSDDEQGFVVECWDTADELSYEPSVSTETFPSVSAVMQRLAEWL
jgi:hypothetical protein